MLTAYVLSSGGVPHLFYFFRSISSQQTHNDSSSDSEADDDVQVAYCVYFTLVFIFVSGADF